MIANLTIPSSPDRARPRMKKYTKTVSNFRKQIDVSCTVYNVADKHIVSDRSATKTRSLNRDFRASQSVNLGSRPLNERAIAVVFFLRLFFLVWLILFLPPFSEHSPFRVSRQRTVSFGRPGRGRREGGSASARFRYTLSSSVRPHS